MPRFSAGRKRKFIAEFAVPFRFAFDSFRYSGRVQSSGVNPFQRHMGIALTERITIMDRREFLIHTGQLGALASGLSSAWSASRIFGQQATRPQQTATGPLRVSAKNPRYFCDASGREVLLVGSHTWNSLVDMGRSDPPEAFDFEAYLDFLGRYGHNFIRLWTWDSTTLDTHANGRLGKDFIHHVAPLPWLRTGPGVALDGKPKFDLKQFDPAYFERLRQRVSAAGRRGIYVSVMLFEGWGLMHGNRRRGTKPEWAWRSHPFHPDNNSSGIDAGGKVHSRANPAVNAIQAAYIRKVVDTVNDLDNVLYEVINEGGEKEWDWWVVDTVRQYERTQPHAAPDRHHGPRRGAAGKHAGQPGRLDLARFARTATKTIRQPGMARRSACWIRITFGAWAATARGSGRA